MVALGTPGGLVEISSIALHIASMWPRPITVVEADPDGGRLAVRHNWMVRPGLGMLVSMLQETHHVREYQLNRDDFTNVYSNIGEAKTGGYGGNIRVVTAPVAPDEVIEFLCEISASTWRMDDVLGTDVLVSVGTIRPGSPSETLIKKADARLLVLRRTIENVAAVIHRRRLLQDIGAWTILTAGGRLTTVELSRVIHWPVLADLLPSDRQNGAVLRQRIAEFAASLRRPVNPGGPQSPRLDVSHR